MDQEEKRIDARRLFEGLCDHDGADARAEVVAPWLDRVENAYRAGNGYRAELSAGVARLCRQVPARPDEEQRNLVWELYALSRVSDVLLLAFQPPADTAGEEPWARRLPPTAQWPALSMAHYLELFTRLGMVPFAEVEAFDPFLHEIVDVEQAESPDEPVRITEAVWPGLWLGPLLFSRAGVRVRAGAHHAERGVADRSPLYWSFLRRHRPTIDQSLGWGHNSQWRTDLRLDYRTDEGEFVNMLADTDADADADLDSVNALLTSAERRDLVRHRCLLRTPANAARLAEHPDWQADLYPFDWQIPSGGAE
ncbi:hypothetical protein AB5J56_40845 [Streptomyces sp. R21]|uniref:Uncharacterized protein n=1 Tax=Streptomyces sp. R21 TaxID=3238627 RepID=A0AB39PJM1_9ACTN